MSDPDNSALMRDPRIRIPVGSETVAATRYYADEGAEKPVLLMYIPYRKDDFITYGAYQPLIEYLGINGYDVVVADMVGTGASTGSKDDWIEPKEGDEAVQIIEWLADRDWCTGCIGMFGKSYGGITSLRSAAERPDALEAIVPIHAPHTGYRDTYVGGAFALYGIGGHWTPLMQALQAAPPSHRDQDGQWAEIWNERLNDLSQIRPSLFQYLEHNQKDEYWRGREIQVGRINVPTLAVSGWRDAYPHTTIEYYEKIDAPKHLLLGPWRHTMPHRGRETAINFRRLVKEWFDRYLKGDSETSLEDGVITYWTEANGGGTPDEGIWRQRYSWPVSAADNPSDSNSLSFQLAESGLVAYDNSSWDGITREYESDYTVGMDSFDAGTPADTTPDDVRSMTFETGPLDSVVELTGSGVATLRITPTSPDPQLSIRVVDVDPDGSATLVTHGQLRLTHLDGHEELNEVTPGTEYQIEIPLRPKSHLFEAGHKIRVAVSGAFFPVMLPPTSQDTFMLQSTPSSPSVITFPGRKHQREPSFDTHSFSGPESTPPPEPAFVVQSETSWENTREKVENTGTVATTSEQVVDLPHATMRYRENIEASVVADTPSTAGVSRSSEIIFEYETETVRVQTSSVASSATAHAHTSITVDGATVFDELWRQGGKPL